MLAPTVLWAQRTNEIFLTIDLMDIENPQVNLTAEELHFQGRSQDKDYEVNLKFYSKIDPEVIIIFCLVFIIIIYIYNINICILYKFY